MTASLQPKSMDPHALFESDDLTWLEKPDRDVESNWVERKLKIDARDLAEQVSAFANGQPPGGLIVIDVAKDGTIAGIEDRAPDDLLRKLGDHVDGQLGQDWEYRFIDAPGNKRVLLLYVPFAASRVLCTAGGAAFRRVGDSTIKLSSEQIADLRDAKGEKRFDVRPIAPFTDDAIDHDVAERFLEGVKSRNHLTLPLTLEAALQNKKLIVPSKGGAMMTVAGIVVLGKTPTDFIPGARLRFLVFEGTNEKFGSERNAVRDRWFEGPIPTIVNDVRDFMRTQVRDLEYLGPNGTFVREPEFPEAAWQEAIVNALVHRSYTLQNTPVFVRRFDDRIEVESPGGYPGGNHPTPEGLFPFTHPRNPAIAEALQYLQLVWLSKEGTRRMHDEMQRLDLPVPEFRDDGGIKVVVTLRSDWERRRLRTGEVARTQWNEIEGLLKDDYAIRRWRGIQAWRRLSSSSATPPQTLISTAFDLIRRPVTEIGGDQKRDILDLIQKLPDDVLLGSVEQLTRDLIASLWTGEGEDVNQLLQLISRFDPTVDIVLDYIETQGVGLANAGILPMPRLENLLRVLLYRLNREPFPSRDWLERVVSVSKQSNRSPIGASLHTTITGKAPA